MANVRAELEDVLAEVRRDLGRSLQLRSPRATLAADLPAPMQVLYAACDGGELGFGTLFSHEQARAKAAAFSPGWFPFGSDDRFSFWLCSRRERADGLWLTSWDHESGTEPEAGFAADVASFLRDEYESRLSQHPPEASALIITAVPDAARAATVSELKTLTGLGTAIALQRLRSLPVEIGVPSLVEAHAFLGRLRDRGGEGHLRLDFF